MMGNMLNQIQNGVRRIRVRTMSPGVPEQEEIERFGAAGEDAIFRILYEQFDCVIRGVILPHGKKYLEKDFLVLHKGVPVVIEVKNWKGSIGCDAKTGNFYQDKPDGVHKTIKSPVGTTRQFIQCMKEFYGLERTVVGMVVFAEPDCRLQLPDSMEQILLVPAAKMASAIRAKVREYAKEQGELPPERILRCTRIYSRNSEFCKGLLANREIPCTDPEGRQVSLQTDYLRYIRVEPQPLHLRDKLTVTYINGACGIFYNSDAELALHCLDGSWRRIALNKIRHILF